MRTQNGSHVLQCLGVSILLLQSVSLLPVVRGQTSTTTGSVTYSFGSNLSNDVSNYTLYYTLPQEIQSGVKANMSFYVYLTLLSGWKLQSQSQILQVTIDTPEKQVAIQTTQNNVTLYQGARWGPFNMTFDVDGSQAGLSPGQAVNATVFATLTVFEAYDNPVSPFVHDSGATMRVASLLLEAGPGGSSSSTARVFGSLAVGMGVVAVLAIVAVASRRRVAPSSTRQGT
jgi:hypothetical protein